MKRTNRKPRSEITKDSSAHLKVILESAKDFAIISMDLMGRIVVWSAGAENLFGYTAEEIAGMSFSILFTAEDCEEGIPEHELKTALEENSAIDERWQCRKDDSHFFASGIVRTIQNDEGEVIGFLKILRDLTAHRLLEQERANLLLREQATRRKLEQVNQVIMNFVAIVSHEVRSPLSSIKGYISTLLADDVQFEPGQQREFLEIIDMESDRLTELSNQLLDFTRLETGTLGVRRERTTFDAVLKEIKPQLNMLVPHHDLVMDVPQTLPTLDIDITRIGQVVINLVGNAARYCPADTTIILQARTEGEHLRINVIDQGPGIPPDKRGHIFEPFVQLDIDRQQETKGAGLGLSIAKGIVEAHGGRIWIEDQGDRGTIVSFTLPIASPSSDG